MKISTVFAGIISLFVVLLLLGMGLFLLSLKLSSNLCARLCEILMYNPDVFFTYGLVFIFLGFIFLALFYSIHHHKYLTLRVKPFYCDVDGQIIGKYAKKCFEKILQEKPIEVEVFPKKERLEIVAYIPNSDKFEEGFLINDAKNALRDVLKKHFAYDKEFFLTLKFK
jgi:hypothetical protein